MIAATLATAVLVAWLPGSALLRAALVIGLGAYAILTMRHCAARSAAHAIVAIELDAEHAVRLIERGGAPINGRVQADSYVGAWVTTLVVLADGKRFARTLAILPDMLPAEDFRRLRLHLRHGRDAANVRDR